MRFIRGHVVYLQRRERLSPDLWRVVDTGYETPCWLCIFKPSHPRGYTKASLRGEQVSVHRAMYEQEIGPIPDGLTIDHLCQQTSCMNPEHLEAVTVTENLRRGRRVKLTIEKAREIRESEGTQMEIAAAYGVDQSMVSRIRSGKAWLE